MRFIIVPPRPARASE